MWMGALCPSQGLAEGPCVHCRPDALFSGCVCGVRRKGGSFHASLQVGLTPGLFPSLAAPAWPWEALGAGPPVLDSLAGRLLRPLTTPRSPRMALEASGGGSRPLLSVLLAPGHVGPMEEPPGPPHP